MNRTQNIEVAVDAIVFGYSKEEGVSILLIKRKYDPYKGAWAIPGGFVLDDESLEAAVARELQEETGVEINYLEQLYTFGKPDRDPRKRILSVAYFGLVKSKQFEKLKASTDAADAAWFNYKKLPRLAFDHKEILKMAIERLRAKIVYQPIGFELLDKKFAFSDLEHLYSTLLDRPIDRRNFKKKVMSLGILDELDEKAKSTGAGRPGNLFQFNKTTYNRLLKEGMHFEI
ncbi:NUDIX domain-containing protein [uncultured Roseivirga sp.]|uniref:NUDIX hydrolase n=1 Tax=uncultured Roseivirga sp. TaxID=543088 RepID=UPI0030DCA5BE